MIIHMYILFPHRRAEKLNINFLVFTNIFYYTEIFFLELDCKCKYSSVENSYLLTFCLTDWSI